MTVLHLSNFLRGFVWRLGTTGARARTPSLPLSLVFCERFSQAVCVRSQKIGFWEVGGILI
jgi:hypothetical protein